MRCVVLVKEVPDTYGERKLSLETGLADRSAGDVVLDEVDERALELALVYADAHPDCEVIAMSMGPESITPTLRKCLAMGAARAVHVVDGRLAGADYLATADALAAALKRARPDVVIAGNRSTDGSGGIVPAMVAEMLDIAYLGNVSRVELSETGATAERSTESSIVRLEADLPVLLSVTEQMPPARFPNFKGMMAAKKKPIDVVTVDELGIDPDSESDSHSIMISISERPARQAGVRVVDDGDAGEKLADYLISSRLI
jgi:electron transfer flavoprotein beta subunit